MASPPPHVFTVRNGRLDGELELRDLFAAVALAGAVTTKQFGSLQLSDAEAIAVARAAYTFADAMLTVRTESR
jgi:hypothetical protein